MSNNDHWFAWHPIRTVDSGIVWLSVVRRQWDESLNPWADSSGYSGTDGGWLYYSDER
ncbi:hypothetical protein [Pseudomonas phage vB_PsaM_M1]|nr:hypothetical protein [Pseudomonas phage vB_PsaM_M1]